MDIRQAASKEAPASRLLNPGAQLESAVDIVVIHSDAEGSIFSAGQCDRFVGLISVRVRIGIQPKTVKEVERK